MAVSIGQQMGNYQLVRLLGQGGFAEVYLGQHIYLETDVAIKVMTVRLSEGEQGLFLNEARTIAHLRHPHVIRILDFGVSEGLPFIVMDYAVQGTLRHRYPKGTRLSPLTLLPYVKQIASALQYAHDRRLIHRDVKPDNILVESNNTVWLSDFGIAVAAHNSYSMHTQNITGTVNYMAPEQLQGKARPASDQYSLAVVIYELLTGGCPFNGTYVEVGIQHVLNTPPAIREQVPEISTAVEAVVMKALSKDPHQRYESVQEFATAYENACMEQTEHVPAVITTLPLISAQTARQISAEVPSDDATLITYREHEEGVKALAWSPDGQSIVSGGFGETVHVWQVATGKTSLAYKGHSSAVKAVAWSPNGESIASGGSGDKVHIWHAISGRTLSTYTYSSTSQRRSSRVIRALAWSPDGKYLAAGVADGSVYVWSTATRSLITQYQEQGYAVNSVAWSPDGTLVASSGNDGLVYIWQGTTGKTVAVGQGHTKSVYSLSWSPDAQYVASGGGDGIHVWQAAKGQSLLNYREHSFCVYAVDWSPDGRYIASGGDDKVIQIWSALEGGKQVYSYRGHGAFVVALAWSPNGYHIASASDDRTIQIWKWALLET